jgi:hypothetical protein
MPKTGRNGSPLWSQDELDWLYANYRSGDITWMAEQLGRPYRGVAQKLHKHRLSSSGRKLKEISINPKIQVKDVQEPISCALPVFHPVMIGLYPNRLFNGRMWRRRREIILKMHDNLCVYCGDEAFTVDHIIPVDKGGLDNIDNLVAACASCNYSMGNRTKHILWITPKTRR